MLEFLYSSYIMYRSLTTMDAAVLNTPGLTIADLDVVGVFTAGLLVGILLVATL